MNIIKFKKAFDLLNCTDTSVSLLGTTALINLMLLGTINEVFAPIMSARLKRTNLCASVLLQR